MSEQDGNGEEAREFHHAPLVSGDVSLATDTPQVSGVAAAPGSSGGHVMLSLRLWSRGEKGTVNERDVDIALSPRAAAILCRETRRALKACLLDPLEEDE